MKVSVCLASYNGGDWIKRQIDSILNQEFKYHSNVDLELIISDDGSTDNSLKEISQIKDDRIIIIHHKGKQHKFYKSIFAATENSENALMYATGEYIFLSDQDDIWYPNRIDMQLNTLESFDCSACSFVFIDENDCIIGAHPNDNHSFIYMCRNFGLYGFSMAFRRPLLERILPIPTVPQHDMFIGLLAKKMGQLYIQQDVLCAHRIHRYNVSDTGFSVPIIVKFWYRLKMILWVLWRAR